MRKLLITTYFPAARLNMQTLLSDQRIVPRPCALWFKSDFFGGDTGAPNPLHAVTNFDLLMNLEFMRSGG
jgi:hypothetical protein